VSGESELRRAARCLWLVVGVVLMLSGAAPAAAQSAGATWSPGTGASGDTTIQGSIDLPAQNSDVTPGASMLVGGWVVDTSAQGWSGIDGVQILNSSGQSVATGIVGQDRSDVGAALGNSYFDASGFSAVVPADALGSGSQTFTVAAHTPGRGTWTKQFTVNVGGPPAPPKPTGLVGTILVPGENELIQAVNDYTIRGTAYDTRTRAELGVGVDRVQVYLDGPRGVAGSHFLGNANLNGNEWSIDFSPTEWDSFRHHNLWVYVRSSVTGEELLVQRGFDIV
jgi:hypothetical protein